MDSLSNRIRSGLPLPLSEIGEAALESFLALPGVTTWCPDNLWLAELSKIFNIGLPFALLGSDPSAASHRREIGRAVARGENMSPSTWSEVQAGAILSNWGAKVSFIKRGKSPTPDFEAQWTHGVVLDVEVTRAEIRQLHKAVKDGLESFTGALHPSDVDWNVICFIADASNPNDLNAVFDAVTELRPNETKEQPSRWAVRAVPLEQREHVVGAQANKIFAPKWWPSDEPSFFATSTIIGSNSSPVILLRSLIPMTSYMNPIIRKANSGQRHSGHPYLIALDTSEMPRAHDRIAGDLGSYFVDWNHISGVMLFESRFWIGVESKEWIVSIHANPHARLSIPDCVVGIADSKRHLLRFVLSNK